MRRLAVLAFVCLASCARAEMPAPRAAPATAVQASADVDASDAPTPIDEPATLPPIATVGPGAPDPGQSFVASRLAPGHYATDVHFHQESACSQSWESYSAHASLLLDLAPGGVATACRGRKTSDAGPDFHTDMEERQGFRGRWRRDGNWLDIRLALADDPSCPQQRGYTNLEPQAWHLRCTLITPAPNATNTTATITQPVAACQFADRVYMEELGYVVQSMSMMPGEWILLSGGNGLRVVSDQPEPWGQPHYSVVTAPEPVEMDAWRAP